MLIKSYYDNLILNTPNTLNLMLMPARPKTNSVLPPTNQHPSLETRTGKLEGERDLCGAQFLLNNKWFAHNTTINILDIICRGLEMTCCIVRFGDVAVVLCAIFVRNIQICYTHKSTVNHSSTNMGVEREYLSRMGPRRSRPGLISMWGLSVSTIVETMAR